jgi:hypothetical protein
LIDIRWKSIKTVFEVVYSSIITSLTPSTLTDYSISFQSQTPTKMVHYSAIILAVAAVATAIPAGTSGADTIQSDFSFANWVDTIIADPSTALSPEQALEQFHKEETNAGLAKRQDFRNCQQKGDQPALAQDAVSCINELADRGRAGQECDVNSTSKSQCRRGFAQIVTVKSNLQSGPKSMNCNDIARAAGAIMDHCTKNGNTVTGQSIINSIAVHIQEPLI